MADVWNPITREYIRSVDRATYGDPWIVIGKGAYPIDSLPACDPSLWELIEGEIVEGEAVEIPETMAERHAREQREGVTLENGWVMKWAAADQTEMLKAKAIADLAALNGNTSPIVPFFEVDGTPHGVSYSTAYTILGDYMGKVLVEQQRQWTEVANG